MEFKTKFLKLEEVSNHENFSLYINQRHDGKVAFNGDAFAWNSGTLRKIEGLPQIYIASCSEEYGQIVYVEIYNAKTLKRIEYINTTLSEIRSNKKLQNRLIDIAQEIELSN